MFHKWFSHILGFDLVLFVYQPPERRHWPMLIISKCQKSAQLIRRPLPTAQPRVVRSPRSTSDCRLKLQTILGFLILLDVLGPLCPMPELKLISFPLACHTAFLANASYCRAQPGSPENSGRRHYLSCHPDGGMKIPLILYLSCIHRDPLISPWGFSVRRSSVA